MNALPLIREPKPSQPPVEVFGDLETQASDDDYIEAVAGQLEHVSDAEDGRGCVWRRACLGVADASPLYSER
jgi:hypothetical protein